MGEFSVGQKLEANDDGIWVKAEILEEKDGGRWKVKFTKSQIIEIKKTEHLRVVNRMAKFKAKMAQKQKIYQTQPWLDPLADKSKTERDSSLSYNPNGFKKGDFVVRQKVQHQIVDIVTKTIPPSCLVKNMRTSVTLPAKFTELKPEPDWPKNLSVFGSGTSEVNGLYELDESRGKFPKFKHKEESIWVVEAGSGTFWNVRQGNILLYQAKAEKKGDLLPPLKNWAELNCRAFRGEKPMPQLSLEMPKKEEPTVVEEKTEPEPLKEKPREVSRDRKRRRRRREREGSMEIQRRRRDRSRSYERRRRRRDDRW